MKILIVDDSKSVQTLAVTALSKFIDEKNDIVDIVSSFEKAQAAIENFYDIVILDHQIYRYEGDRITADIGYALIKPIKKKYPATIIIGSSSMSSDISGPEPDYQVDKTNLISELTTVLEEVTPTIKKSS